MRRERVLERDVDGSVTVFDVEDDGVAAELPPVLDDAQAVDAAGHDAGQVDGPDLEIRGDMVRLVGGRVGLVAGDHDLLAGLEVSGFGERVGLAKGRLQLGPGHETCLRPELVDDGGQRLRAGHGVHEAVGRGHGRRRRVCIVFRWSGGNALQARRLRREGGCG
jgi:hypothetical protein